MIDFGKALGRKFWQMGAASRADRRLPEAGRSRAQDTPGGLRSGAQSGQPADVHLRPVQARRSSGPGRCAAWLRDTTAAGYDHGAGWSTLADRFGFALLLPRAGADQQSPRLCFNWFSPADTERDGGEPASIKAMVDWMVRDHGIDPRRVFITGLSAGGADDVCDACLLSGALRGRCDHRRPA